MGDDNAGWNFSARCLITPETTRHTSPARSTPAPMDVFRADRDEPYEIPGGRVDTSLGVTEYAQYKQQVEAKRRLVRSEYAHVKRKVTTLKEHMLDSYDKLWNLIEKRREVDEERRKQVRDPAELAQKRLEEKEYKNKLPREINKYTQELRESEADLAMKHNYLSTFLDENGKMLQAVEKGEALDTELRRKVERQHAHTQILDAITGMATFKVATDEMSYQQRQELILSESRARSSVAELQQMLKDLREAEEFTDDLVDRLKNKVESIDLLEESQVEMIDSQLVKQRKLGVKLRELKARVGRNNEELVSVSDRVKMDVTKELERLISPKIQAYLFFAVVLIFICVLAVMIYYVYNTVKP